MDEEQRQEPDSRPRLTVAAKIGVVGVFLAAGAIAYLDVKAQERNP